MSAHVVVYKDTLEGGPESLVERVNKMCGSVLENPRPDLRGDYVVTDITAVQVLSYQTGWGIIAVVKVKPDLGNLPMSVTEVGLVAPADQFFSDARPVLPGDLHEIPSH